MGLELDYRKYFDSPFSWTGDGRLFVAANYTWSDSEVQVDDGDLAYTLAANGRPQAASELVEDGSRLPGTTEHMANIHFGIKKPNTGRPSRPRAGYETRGTNWTAHHGPAHTN